MGKNSDEMCRRRGVVTLELRKARKDNQLLKKRNIAIGDEALSPLQDNNSKSPSNMSLEEIMAGMNNIDESIQLQATQAARKILCRDRNPPIDVIIAAGIVPRCIEFLAKLDNPTLQFEAALALTIVVSGTSEQTNAVVDGGAVPKLVSLLSSPYAHVVEQAVWALGNITADCASRKDLILSYDIVLSLLELFKRDKTVSFLHNIVWTLSNLCYNKDLPPAYKMVNLCFSPFNKLLHYQDNDVLTDTCRALSFFTHGSNDKIQAVIDYGFVPRLVELLLSSEVNVLIPALRTVGNIVTGNDIQADAIIQVGGLKQLTHLLMHHCSYVVKEAARTVINVTARNSDQIQEVINAGIIPQLLDVLKSGDFESQKEAAWAVANYTSEGTVEQISILVQAGVIPLMCKLLDANECLTILMILNGLTNILLAAEKFGEVGRVCEVIEECGGLDHLKNLQGHENYQIYQKCSTIIDTFFFNVDHLKNLQGHENYQIYQKCSTIIDTFFFNDGDDGLNEEEEDHWLPGIFYSHYNTCRTKNAILILHSSHF